MIKYEIITDTLNNECLTKTDDAGIVFWIPKDPANLDYQDYLAWLEQSEQQS
jgi:hypothetical protein